MQIQVWMLPLKCMLQMHVAISNVRCKMDVWTMQKYSSLSIICRVSLTWGEMDAGLLQSKMHDSLSYNPKWMLVCMPGWRGIFCPNMYMSMQNAYGCPY
jgi:hypothetical protein